MARRHFDPNASESAWPQAHASDPDYRRLAASVILRAVEDAKAGDLGAREFLMGGPLLELWAGLAGVNVTAVIDRARTLLTRSVVRRDRPAA